MIVSMQAIAGDGLRDYASFSERIIIRSLEKLLLRMRIGHHLGAMLGQLRPQIAPFITGKPKLIWLDRRIGAADHLKLQIGDDVLQRDWRVLEKVLVALPAGLFTAKEDEENSPLGMFLRQSARQLQHGHAAGGIVVRAIKDIVSTRARPHEI